MGGGVGPMVPSPVKPEPTTELPAPVTVEEDDKEVLCPICMQIIKDAFLTSCGHSFCYMCIVTHLQNKNDCPSCAAYLTPTQIFPNFLLNKLLMKASARQIAKRASPTQQLRQALEQGCDVSVKELDVLLVLLADKKRKMEQEEAETNLQIMRDFLHCLRKQKLEELNEIQNDLHYIKEDIHAVERQRIELYRARERCSVKLRMLSDDPNVRSSCPSLLDKRNSSNKSIGNNAQGQFWLAAAAAGS